MSAPITLYDGCTAVEIRIATTAGPEVQAQAEQLRDDLNAFVATGDPFSVVASDSTITTKIKGKYAADSVVSVFNIGVRTYEGTVTLTGTVGSYIARDQAALLAKETSGVVAVNNQIIVEDQSK